MIKKYLPLLFIFFFFWTSCKTETVESARNLSLEKDFEWATVEHRYKIKVPNYLKSTTILNDEASLQYMHMYKEEYLIIIDESKQEFIDAFRALEAYDEEQNTLKNFHEVQTTHLTTAMHLRPTSTPQFIQLRNTAAYFAEFDANIEGTQETASYFIYHVASTERLYTIMLWTLKKNRDIYREKVKKMLSTFNSLEVEN
ncbi:MAG: hypothetical protein N4A35_16460 [Flavobacteriales bacterium]|jgi:hypothetical protein|nr:hypothetical protein [Flavobacteriales bacterium]